MDNHEIFYKTFLEKIPGVVNGCADFGSHHQLLKESLSGGSLPEQVSDGVHKLVSGNQITYWEGTADASYVSIIVDAEINGNFCKVYNFAPISPPYASDLYLLIQRDLKGLHLVFSRDSMLSVDAVRLWTRIAKQDEHLAVYDTQSSHYAVNPIKSAAELSDYCRDYGSKRYIFVLSETLGRFKDMVHLVAQMELKREEGIFRKNYSKSKEKINVKSTV